MNGMTSNWLRYASPLRWDTVAVNDKYPMLFTPAEMEQLRGLKDALIRRDLITNMNISLGNGITTIGFLDFRQKDNAFFYVQKIKPEGLIPEYRVGSGKIGMSLETINFNVTMASLEEACRPKMLANNTTPLILIHQ
jgi:hypothetical protein